MRSVGIVALVLATTLAVCRSLPVAEHANDAVELPAYESSKSQLDNGLKVDPWVPRVEGVAVGQDESLSSSEGGGDNPGSSMEDYAHGCEPMEETSYEGNETAYKADKKRHALDATTEPDVTRNDAVPVNAADTLRVIIGRIANHDNANSDKQSKSAESDEGEVVDEAVVISLEDIEPEHSLRKRGVIDSASDEDNTKESSEEENPKKKQAKRQTADDSESLGNQRRKRSSSDESNESDSNSREDNDKGSTKGHSTHKAEGHAATTHTAATGSAQDHSAAGAAHDHAAHDHTGHDHAAHDHSAHDHAAHDHAGHDHAAHDHTDHDHAGHDHAAHDHAGHDHAGHDHAAHDHAAHDHTGHDHAATDEAHKQVTTQEGPKDVATVQS